MSALSFSTIGHSGKTPAVYYNDLGRFALICFPKIFRFPGQVENFTASEWRPQTYFPNKNSVWLIQKIGSKLSTCQTLNNCMVSVDRFEEIHCAADD